MTDVITLLELPKTSKGFSALKTAVIQIPVDGSASPPRKKARLGDDSDSSSVSRLKPPGTGNDRRGGPVILQIAGDPRELYFVERNERKGLITST